MLVLDLDLDFFLTDCCPLAKYGERPDSSCAKPWETDKVVCYLERNLGLSRERPIPGVITQTHDGALGFWKRCMQSGILSKPFGAVHVDTHSDLGIGKPGPGFVLNNVLGIPPQKRDDIQNYYAQKQLDEANYLLFALAFRWIDSLTLVRNPFSRQDYPSFVVREDENCRPIRLQSFVSRLFESTYGAEPSVPLRIFEDPMQFRSAEPFVCMNLACSPRYAPREADTLIPVIAEYMHLVTFDET